MVGLLDHITRELPVSTFMKFRESLEKSHCSLLGTASDSRDRSSKSALHGLVHWLAGAYATSGVTINGVAPALIQETTMLPGNNEELAKSKFSSTLGED